jgi:hypothetical protein
MNPGDLANEAKPQVQNDLESSSRRQSIMAEEIIFLLHE